MSQHRRKNYEPDGLLTPDLEYRTSPRHIRRAAAATAANGHSVYAEAINSELSVAPLRGPVIGIRQLDDPDTRVYSVPALLRVKMERPIMVRAGDDLEPYTELTQIGRALAPAIAAIFGVNFVIINRTELFVDIAGSFDWDDDEHIHEQIIELIERHIGLEKTGYIIRWISPTDKPDAYAAIDPPDTGATT